MFYYVSVSIKQNMKTSSLVLLVLYYCIGFCHGYKDMHKMRKSLFKKGWHDHTRHGRTIGLGRLSFLATPPDTKEVAEGESFILLCKVQSVPSANIYWKKGGVTIIQGTSSSVTTYEDQATSTNRPTLRLNSQTSRLYVDCFDADKAGAYECVAETSHLNISHTTLVKPSNSLAQNVESQCVGANEDEREPARIYLFTTYRIERANATVQLVCRAKGSPTPNITWSETGPLSGLGYELKGNGDLVLETDKVSGGFHSYYCEAKNSHGTDKVKVVVYLTI